MLEKINKRKIISQLNQLDELYIRGFSGLLVQFLLVILYGYFSYRLIFEKKKRILFYLSQYFDFTKDYN